MSDTILASPAPSAPSAPATASTTPPASSAPSAPSGTPSSQPASPATSGDWFASLPPELAGDPTLASFKGKTPADVAKSLVNAQKLIGSKGLIQPAKDAPPEEWGKFWNALGRPESPDKYQLPDKLPEGVAVDKSKLAAFSKWAHEQGFNDQQHAAMIRYEADRQATEAKNTQQARVAKLEQDVTALRKDWGDSFDQKIGLAREAAKRFGGEDILSDESLGNDPRVIRMLATVGKLIAQDEVIGTGRGTQFRLGPAEAQAKIQGMYADPAISKSLANRRDPNHEKHKAEMESLYSIAYPGKTDLRAGNAPRS